jgi:hypothetical protein
MKKKEIPHEQIKIPKQLYKQNISQNKPKEEIKNINININEVNFINKEKNRYQTDYFDYMSNDDIQPAKKESENTTLNKLQKLKALKVNLNLSNVDKSSSDHRSDSNKSDRDNEVRRNTPVFNKPTHGHRRSNSFGGFEPQLKDFNPKFGPIDTEESEDKEEKFSFRNKVEDDTIQVIQPQIIKYNESANESLTESKLI